MRLFEVNDDSATVEVLDVSVGPHHPVRVMGVINLSPESFYKASIAASEEDARSTILVMLRHGADMIDIGGASTSPKNTYNRDDVSTDEEKRRVVEFLRTFRDEFKTVPISVDTSSADIAREAIALGASLINDVSGLQGDKDMAKVVADSDVPVILMANCGVDCPGVDMILTSLRKSLDIASDAGIPPNRIILDPGIGFGKTAELDLSILRNLRLFTYLGRPLLVGVSRKAFIGRVLERPDPRNRLAGSLAATTIAVYNGASIIRTHDVEETIDAIRIGEAIRGTRLPIE
ncbi:MAG: dihydropteroate synthase [Candidatus Thorarchaeota archaeon]|nr:MAG: dihydropteroate synthase [Candidatus Thorarchaeota archaeon]RLI60240.1 MAG: dihydropteroate synthase [Candidatus Thorarchaeota archaeon]